MEQRPLPFAIISWFFILFGAAGILRGLYEFDKDIPWVIGSATVALAEGLLLRMGRSRQASRAFPDPSSMALTFAVTDR